MLKGMPSAVLIRAARRTARLTQAELASRLGTTQPVVARLERLDANPTLATLERALEAAGYELELRAVPKQHRRVDESQIRERLRWSPAERLAAHGAAQRNVGALLRGARLGDHG
jgi:transcriptional regulator with XRE-family HTH domain